jgi:hypothetical protein
MGPLSLGTDLDPGSGIRLLDEEGYFYRNQDLWRSLDPKAVRTEMETRSHEEPVRRFLLGEAPFFSQVLRGCESIGDRQ